MSPILILSRAGAFRVAWKIFWMATGTKRVGLVISDDQLEILGNAFLGED